MELTTNNLVKIAIAVVVIVLVIFGIYMGMKNYIIPYFKGLGFEFIGVLVSKLANNL